MKNFANEKFDIIILAGQSNAQGYGAGPVSDPYQPDKHVWYLNPDMTIALATETVVNNGIFSNFSLSFAREYRNAGKLSEDRNLLILRCAVGGTAFLSDHWKLTDPLHRQMMNMTRAALELNPENRLTALLWHQGESDAECGATYEQHYGNLSALVNCVRDTFGTPDLPFIAGDFVHDWEDDNSDKCTPVVKAIRAVCRDLGHSAFVETEGLNSNRQDHVDHPYGWVNDAIHFSRQSLYTLGKLYFDKFNAIVSE